MDLQVMQWYRLFLENSEPGELCKKIGEILFDKITKIFRQEVLGKAW